MQDLQIFNNQEFGEIRVIKKDGEPWFVGKDVCDILELKNPTMAISRLDADEVTKFNLGGLSGETNIVNEYGLYSLILGSRKVEAKKFKRWITHEVIPSIRKHGTYMTDETIEKVLSDPDTIIKLATQLKETKKELQEKNRFMNQIASSNNSLLVREVAKVVSKKGISIGEKRLWNKLRDWGLIFKNKTEPMQEYIDRGYFEVVEGVKESSKGTFTYRTTKVTGKGQVYIIKRLIEENLKEEVAVTN